MNRIGEMKAYLETEKEAFLQKRLSEMAQACSKSCGESGKDLCCVMERLALREGGVFGISFLRSSYITGKHVFYVAHYLDDPFVEEAPEAVCLSMAGLFDKAEADSAALAEKLEGKFIRMYPGIREEIRRWYLDGLYERMDGVFTELLRDMWKEEGREVLYGGYMGEQKILGRI